MNRLWEWYAGDNDSRIARYASNRKGDSEYIEMPNNRPFDFLKSVFIFFAGLAIILAIWQIYAWWANEIDGSLLAFPYPMECVERLIQYFTQEELIFGVPLIEHVQASLGRWFEAFFMSAVCGVTLGLIIGCFKQIYPIAISSVNIIQMIPGAAWIPVAILLLGIGDAPAVFIIWLISFVIITINVSGGIRRIPEVYLRVADMMGANIFMKLFKVIIPFALLDTINGLRLGMGSALRVLMSAEMIIGTGVGVGFVISELRGVLDYVGAFACIMIIGMIGLLIDKIVFVNIEKYVRHELNLDEDV